MQENLTPMRHGAGRSPCFETKLGVSGSWDGPDIGGGIIESTQGGVCLEG